MSFLPMLADATTTPMEDLMADMSTIFNKVILWVVTIVAKIAAEPILLLTIVGFVTVGFAFGLVRRLIHS